MTNSERAAADQRLMDAMQKEVGLRPFGYEGEVVAVVPGVHSYPVHIKYGISRWLEICEARRLHRELGEALAAIEAQFGEKPDGPVREDLIRRYMETESAKPSGCRPPEDAPGARETIWGSWSDTPTVSK